MMKTTCAIGLRGGPLVARPAGAAEIVLEHAVHASIEEAAAIAGAIAAARFRIPIGASLERTDSVGRSPSRRAGVRSELIRSGAAEVGAHVLRGTVRERTARDLVQILRALLLRRAPEVLAAFLLRRITREPEDAAEQR